MIHPPVLENCLDHRNEHHINHIYSGKTSNRLLWFLKILAHPINHPNIICVLIFLKIWLVGEACCK